MGITGAKPGAYAAVCVPDDNWSALGTWPVLSACSRWRVSIDFAKDASVLCACAWRVSEGEGSAGPWLGDPGVLEARDAVRSPDMHV